MDGMGRDGMDGMDGMGWMGWMGLISREEFITYMLDNRARAFPYIQKS
jgi:hypothetical protein